MEAVTAAVQARSPVAYRAILSSGLLCGALDISAAFVTSGLRGASPMRVLRYIAAGWLGPRSFNDGLASAGLGLVSHFLIALGASSAFYLASRKLDFLTDHAVMFGILYGVAVYLFMNQVVVPLSAAPKIRFSAVSLVIGLTVHILCVGLPISLTIRWYSR